MKNFLQDVDFYINQYDLEKVVFDLGKTISARGWLLREEFIAICLWKSRRPKHRYLQNTSATIKAKTKMCFEAGDEEKRMKLLVELAGVSVPTASAILSVINPTVYPIIDIRCVQSLRSLGLIEWNTITIESWGKYLEVVRKLAKQTGKTAREVEKALFAYNRMTLDKDFKNLYK